LRFMSTWLSKSSSNKTPNETTSLSLPWPHIEYAKTYWGL
jgi:hypothetical protein